MDYNKFMGIVEDYGNYVREYGHSSLEDKKWYDLMLGKWKEICEIAVQLDFSNVKENA